MPRSRRLLLLLAAGLVVAVGAAALVALAPDSRSARRPRPAARVKGTTTTTVPPPPVVAAATASRSFTVTGDRAGFAHGYELVHLDSDADVARDLDAMAATGARWLRAVIDWSLVEGGGRGAFDWPATDRIVRGARARGISVVAVITGTPTWALGGPCRAFSCPPADVGDYAAFARLVAVRYGPLGVWHWEIWNEPNHSPFWGPRPDVGTYTELLERASAAIKSVQPGAVVITGGMSPAGDTGADIAPVTFLRGIYDHGGQASFDAVGHHPYAFPFHPTSPVDGNAFLQTPQLYDVMTAHGDGAKKIWGTEVGVPTRGSVGVGEAGQAERVSEYYDSWNSWSFTGPLLWYKLRDTTAGNDAAERSFGLLHADRSPKPAFDVFVRMIAAAAPLTPAASPG
jgi:polysaccharide biosynthesis protein PslG